MKNARLVRILALVLACVVVVGARPVLAEEADEATRAEMRRILAALSGVLPAAVSEGRFTADENRWMIEKQLALLAASAEALSAHGAGSDASFDYLSRSLASDAEGALRRYRSGHYRHARLAVERLTDNCMSCHTRLAGEPSKLAESLLEDVELQTLPLRDRARLQAATRQFDAALDSFETLFGAEEVSPETLDLEGDLMTYLTIAVRVRRSPARARGTLEILLARTSASVYLGRYLKVWIESLKAIESEDWNGDPVKRAHVLADKAKAARRFPAGREGAVYDLAASSYLFAFVASDQARGERLAEAYYLLGLTDAWTQRAGWVSQAAFYLDTAVRSAPGTQIARDAFARYEEYVMLEHAGADGGKLPPAVTKRVNELRRLAVGG